MSLTQPSDNGRTNLLASPGFHFENLVTARRRLGMSQGELARRLEVDQSTVSRLERGEMQSPPWKLVVQVCLHLQLEPHALMEVGRAITCRDLPIARARVSHHFLYLGSFSRLPEMLHYCLFDISHVRPTVVGVSLLLFHWPDASTRQYYAHWQAGQISFAERIEPPRPSKPVERLQQLWEGGQVSHRQGREELRGWDPAIAIDVPMTHGMFGLDFSEEEGLETDTDFWVGRIAETFERGLSLVGERQGRESTEDLHDISARLTALEQRLK
jgi:DNA-binding XRE family transcriptional regulator